MMYGLEQYPMLWHKEDNTEIQIDMFRFNDNLFRIHIQQPESKVGDYSRGRPEGSLFNSYDTEV